MTMEHIRGKFLAPISIPNPAALAEFVLSPGKPLHFPSPEGVAWVVP